MALRTAGMIMAFLALLPVTGARCDDGALAPYHADYSLARNSLTLGTARFSLEPDAAGSYLYKSVSHATGLAALFAGDVITQKSRFELVDGQPRPLSYSYTQAGGKHEQSEETRFDWNKMLAHSDWDDHSRDSALKAGVSDVFLIQLVLAVDVSQGRLAKQYVLLNHGETTAYEPRRLDDQKMKVGAKVVDTTVLELKDPKKGRAISLWLAPGLRYLPVQIQQSEPGKATFTLSMDDISFDAAAPAAASKR